MNPLEKVLEQVLILRAQMGDTGAFEHLVERYSGKITYYIRRLVDDEESVKDILQNVWLAVFRQLPKWRSSEAFPVWLYRIARNQAMEYLQKRRLYKEFNDEIPSPDVGIDTEEEINLSAHSAAHIHQALNQMRPEHKEVLLLKFFENLSYQEVASVIGCPIGTVRSRIHYAKNALHRILEETGHEDESKINR